MGPMLLRMSSYWVTSSSESLSHSIYWPWAWARHLMSSTLSSFCLPVPMYPMRSWVPSTQLLLCTFSSRHRGASLHVLHSRCDCRWHGESQLCSPLLWLCCRPQICSDVPVSQVTCAGFEGTPYQVPNMELVKKLSVPNIPPSSSNTFPLWLKFRRRTIRISMSDPFSLRPLPSFLPCL